MNYIEKEYKDFSIKAQVSNFSVEGGITEYQVMLAVTDPMLSFAEQFLNLQKAYSEVVRTLLLPDSVAVFRRYFLSDAANQTDSVMAWECEQSLCALSVVEQAPMNGTKIAMWTYLQTSVTASLHQNGMLEVSHSAYSHLWTGCTFNKAANSEYQTRLILNDYILQLTEQGCKLSENCVRTWFFVQNVDVNYAGVVKARKEVFATQNLTEKTHYIASTGIEGRHASPQVLVEMDAYSVKGLVSGQIQYLYGRSHLNPTYEYGVTFERGTAVTYGDRKHVFISGTASINNKGEILHPGDIRKQADRMIENVSVLLNEAGAGFGDVAMAIIYLRDTADAQLVRHLIDERFPGLPHLVVHAPVCRPGWLIEMECFAILPASEPQYYPL